MRKTALILVVLLLISGCESFMDGWRQGVAEAERNQPNYQWVDFTGSHRSTAEFKMTWATCNQGASNAYDRYVMQNTSPNNPGNVLAISTAMSVRDNFRTNCMMSAGWELQNVPRPTELPVQQAAPSERQGNNVPECSKILITCKWEKECVRNAGCNANF